jgi:hypothetical protein
LLQIKDEWLQLFVGSFDKGEFSFNLFSQSSPFMMLFFNLVYNKDYMVLVFFRAALCTEEWMGLVVRATLIQANEHYFKADAAFALIHVVKLQYIS